MKHDCVCLIWLYSNYIMQVQNYSVAQQKKLILKFKKNKTLMTCRQKWGSNQVMAG